MVEPTEEVAEAGVGLEAQAALEEARGWIGAKLDVIDGDGIARVDGLLVDARDGSPTWAVIRLGRLRRRCAIPAEFVAAGVGHVWIPYSREIVRRGADIDPARGLSCGEERLLAGRYEIPEATGRLAAIAALADDEPGSVPAG